MHSKHFIPTYESSGHASARKAFVLPSFLPEEQSATEVEVQLAEPAAPPPPVFTEADIKNAEQEGYRKGFLEGTTDGRKQAEAEQDQQVRLMQQALEQTGRLMDKVIDDYNAYIAQQQAAMPKLALSIARKIAGKALNENALTLLESIVLPCVEKSLGSPQISITVNDTLAQRLEETLSTHFAGNHAPGEIAIHSDPDMQPGDCRVEWAGGALERNTNALWQQVEAIVDNMIAANGGNAEPEPEAAASAQEQNATPETEQPNDPLNLNLPDKPLPEGE